MARLKEGSKAPDFAAKTFDGKVVKLSDFKKRLVWLIFYRYPGCPLCNLHVSAIRNREEWLKKLDLNVIAVFDSPAEKFPKTLGGREYPKFPIIADPAKELYNLYGTERRMSAVVTPQAGVGFLKAIFGGQKQGKITGDIAQIPAHFLIAEDGVIEKVYYGENIADHIPWSEVEAFVQGRKLGDWKPGGVIV